jgi:beta-glucanase (GH16 family)
MALAEDRWLIWNASAPGSITGEHASFYAADHVSLSAGYLTLLLTQENGTVDDNPDGVVSRGALISSPLTYRYGTYEWRMRLTSTATSPTNEGTCQAQTLSGSVAAGFVYVNNSETEIDIEYAGHRPDLLFLANWRNTNPSSDPQPDQSTFTAVLDSAALPQGQSWCSDFRTYKFVWEPARITFYIDDQRQAEHTTTVPETPAYFMISIRGTNQSEWGGTATIGTPRYLHVDWVRYTPPS